MNLEHLKQACKGNVIVAGDADFTTALHQPLWNRLIPERAPAVIVQVTDEDDVIAAVRFARENRLKVVVRGGGHNWSQPSLRHGGMLIDLGQLTGVVSIDEANLKAVIRPIISNRDIQKALNPKGLAFPSGHCPQVKASGYFLGGGMAWNPTVWGTGAENLEAVELVTAQGERITASEHENRDYFWAVRGAGSGFFGIALRYHLKLYPLPKAIYAYTAYYALEEAPAVGRWLGEAAPTIAPCVELSQFIVQAPPELQAKATASNGWICMVTGTAFEETTEAALAALRPLDEGPLQPLGRLAPAPTTFEQLFNASGALWPEGARSKVEATFSNHNPGEMMEAILPLISKAPSPTTVFLFTIFCGPNVPAKPKGMALSMSGKVYGGPWTTWWEPAGDAINSAWHEEMITTLRPYNVGYYIGESDTVTRPATAVEAYAPENWQRLCDLRAKYDPEGLFFHSFEGYTPAPQ